MTKLISLFDERMEYHTEPLRDLAAIIEELKATEVRDEQDLPAEPLEQPKAGTEKPSWLALRAPNAVFWVGAATLAAASLAAFMLLMPQTPEGRAYMFGTTPAAVDFADAPDHVSDFRDAPANRAIFPPAPDTERTGRAFHPESALGATQQGGPIEAARVVFH